MMARSPAKRKYHPDFEGLELKQSPSAGLSVVGAEALARATPAAVSGAEVTHMHTCGTGKGIVIITQGEAVSLARHTV
jgi:hypothetical protein